MLVVIFRLLKSNIEVRQDTSELEFLITNL